MTTTRKSVRRRTVGRYHDPYTGSDLGPVSVLRITYTDGRRTWGAVRASLGAADRLVRLAEFETPDDDEDAY